uniref:Uncharacterized protein n=2 Tax=Pyxicephalus adspersus TaxID=30357 RepID=A0AAV2ZH14_PYXAD|nr:TPA: hypothetical protein GDO54_003807 [Pyxicephalus adspersus]
MGAILSINGTSVSDVVCLPKPSKIPTTTTAVITLTTKAQEVPTYGMSVTIVVIPVICFIIVSLAIFLCLSLRLEKIKNKFKKIKQTEQEDACSYHYPEEEHGGEEETLSPEP